MKRKHRRATLHGVLLLGGGLLFGCSAGIVGAQGQSALPRGPGPSAVPFVSQAPLLCGGAAAVMMERFWGRTGVRARAYADLIRPAEGGIRTDELAQRLRERGFRVHTQRGRPDLAALDRGEPLLVLLGGAEDLRHYVVLTAADARRMWIHDPNAGPNRTVGRPEFLTAWSEADYWSLSIRPDPARVREEEVVAEGDGTQEEEGLDPARAATVQEAIEALREGEPDRSLRLAEELPDTGRAGRLAWRIQATARFRLGDRDAALEAWNRLGEPRLDHLDFRGFRRTRHRVVEDHVELETGDLVRPGALHLARRRLGALPGVERTRFDLTLTDDGRANLRGHVVTARAWPKGTRLAVTGMRALFRERATVAVGPLTSLGEQWSFRAQWARARQELGGAVEVPGRLVPGVVRLSLGREEERYGSVGSPSGASRVLGGVRVRRWVRTDLRLGVGLGVERRETRGRMVGASLGLGAILSGDSDGGPGWTLHAGVRGWAGETLPAGGASLEIQGSIRESANLALRLRGGVHTVSRNASTLDWPGAGTGRIRTALLRGEPLIREGRVAGPGFGRHLLHFTLSQEWNRGAGPLEAGVAVFADGAWVAGRPGRSGSRGLLTPGAGIFLDLLDRRTMLSVAWGSGGPVWSIRFAPARLIPEE